MTDVPHFGYPFRFKGGQAVVVEQDSPEDVENCVLAILKTRQGTRLDVPGFGVRELEFVKDSVRLKYIQDALNSWEPRAEYDITSQPDKLERMLARVTVQSHARSDA
jgi:phage baseplate assembly protein W